MTGLQTVYAAVQTVLPELSPAGIAALFSTNARKIFALPFATINEGSAAEITIFDSTGKTLFNKEEIKSKSYNSAFIGKELSGKVIGTFNKGSLFLN